MQNITLENIIFTNLLKNEEYLRQVSPFLQEEYFTKPEEKVVYKLASQYFEKYNSVMSAEACKVELDCMAINDSLYKDSVRFLVEVMQQPVTDDFDWLIENTEKYIQDKAIYNAIMESIQVIDGKTDQDRGALPEILSKALSVSFDTSVGHDFLEASDERYDFYHKSVERIPFDIALLNTITRGGVPRKTLNVILAGTAVGKSLMMCHFAASNLMAGSNVLYITLEMAEERISERIDANLLNIAIDELADLPKDSYQKKIQKLRDNTTGKLIVKEYPTSSVNAGHFRHLLNELKIKKNFIPDIIYVDYINLCNSSRIKAGSAANSYTIVKSIAEELRGLAVEFDLPIFTATQTNREGFSSSDVDLTNTSESFGLPATADFMFAAISSEELEELGQLTIKQLKNRYASAGHYQRFTVGINRSKMKLFDAEYQPTMVDSHKDTGPVMDNTSFGAGLKTERIDTSIFETFK